MTLILSINQVANQSSSVHGEAQSQVISPLCDNKCILRSQILESQVISPLCDNKLQDHTISILRYVPSLGDRDFYIKLMSGIGRQIQIYFCIFRLFQTSILILYQITVACLHTYPQRETVLI